MVTIVALLFGADLPLVDIMLTVDGILLALAVAAWQYVLVVRPRFDRVDYGLRRGEAPHVLVLSPRSKKDVVLGNRTARLTFSAGIRHQPRLSGLAGGELRWDQARPEVITIRGSAMTLSRDRDAVVELDFGAEARPEVTGELTLDPPLPNTLLRPLPLVRKRSRTFLVCTGVAAAALVVGGVLVSRLVTEPWAPLTGRLLIIAALVPIAIGFVHARVFDRY